MLAMVEAIREWRKTLTSRTRPNNCNIGVSIRDIAPPRWQSIIADLVAHRAQADTQQFSGARPVATRRYQCDFEQPLLHALEGKTGAKTIPAWHRYARVCKCLLAKHIA